MIDIHFYLKIDKARNWEDGRPRERLGNITGHNKTVTCHGDWGIGELMILGGD